MIDIETRWRHLSPNDYLQRCIKDSVNYFISILYIFVFSVKSRYISVNKFIYFCEEELFQ